jgi:hypothetical protein
VPLDRRSNRRVGVRLVIDQFSGQEHWVGVGFNLSAGGVYLCQRPQAIAGQMALEIDVPELGDTIWTKAEVRSVDIQGPIMGIGLEFTAMANEHRYLLHDWTDVSAALGYSQSFVEPPPTQTYCHEIMARPA